MAELGHFALILAFVLSSYAIPADLLGRSRGITAVTMSGRSATVGCFACLTVATAVLWLLLIRSDFNVAYVAEHTSGTPPLMNKIGALWAGAAGSLLFWLWMQSGFVALVFRKCKENQRGFSAGARPIANLVGVFFLIVLVFKKNPFSLSASLPPGGAELGPVLGHPAMVLGSPIVLIGYAALAIPFAWAFASLKWDGEEEPVPLFGQARNWILLGWLFLTAGIVLAAWSAYQEPGSTGHWARELAKNASLLPWLTGAAMLYCSRTCGRNTSVASRLTILCLVTYSLCILSTFLARPGWACDMCAFPDPALGRLFVVLLIHIWVASAILLWRKHKRRQVPQHKGDAAQ
ncbi:MAG: cytochrome c biogenesis protein CcsA [Planctomycetota bacterium]